ncbi:MAG TPA: nitroreductase family protein [Acidimicrobiia bacterium]
MEFREVVSKRRMVRNYLADAVDQDAIGRIVDAGRRAPSAGFTQGQSFVVVTDPSLRSAIARIADERHYVSSGFDPWISRAPVHIVVCVSEEAYHRRYREADKLRDDGSEIEWPVPFWWVDAGASMMAVLLAAVDEGLAAGFLGASQDLKAVLGIPDDVTPVGIVTVGHPAPDRRSASLLRGWKPDDQVVHWQRW